MKIRIKFEKTGSMKFVGHLDLMRFFQKAMRRAEIDIVYTEGFSPHQVMSFAAPLGVGLTSEGEYMDIEVHHAKSSKQLIDALNAAMVDGVRIISARELPEDSKNAMSIVAGADYRIHFREGYIPTTDLANAFSQFVEQNEIQIFKKSKKSERMVDIKPMIYSHSVDGNDVYLKLATGSAENLKPELVMEAFVQYLGLEWNEMSILVHRLELYADQGEEGNRNLISLESLGEEIER